MYCIKYNSGYFSDYHIENFKIVPHIIYLNEHTESFQIRMYVDDIAVEEELDTLRTRYNMECQKVLLIEQLI